LQLNKTKKQMKNMAAKIQIKNDRINSFGVFFFIIEYYRFFCQVTSTNKTLRIS